MSKLKLFLLIQTCSLILKSSYPNPFFSLSRVENRNLLSYWLVKTIYGLLSNAMPIGIIYTEKVDTYILANK